MKAIKPKKENLAIRPYKTILGVLLSLLNLKKLNLLGRLGRLRIKYLFLLLEVLA
jgi:hypothetical protein